MELWIEMLHMLSADFVYVYDANDASVMYALVKLGLRAVIAVRNPAHLEFVQKITDEAIIQEMQVENSWCWQGAEVNKLVQTLYPPRNVTTDDGEDVDDTDSSDSDQ